MLCSEHWRIKGSRSNKRRKLLTCFTNSLFKVYNNLSLRETRPKVYNNIEVAKSDNRRIVASYLCWLSNKVICATSRNMGITWMCEILIITLFVILMVVPLAVVLIVVEFMMRRRVLRRNRVCNSRPFNTYALANL